MCPPGGVETSPTLRRCEDARHNMCIYIYIYLTMGLHLIKVHHGPFMDDSPTVDGPAKSCRQGRWFVSLESHDLQCLTVTNS